MPNRTMRSISTVAATVALSLALGGVAVAGSNGGGMMGGMGSTGDHASSGGTAMQQWSGAQPMVAPHTTVQTQTGTTTHTGMQTTTQTTIRMQTPPMTQATAQAATQMQAQTRVTLQQHTEAGPSGESVRSNDSELSGMERFRQQRLRDEYADGSGRLCPQSTADVVETSARMWRLHESS